MHEFLINYWLNTFEMYIPYYNQPGNLHQNQTAL